MNERGQFSSYAFSDEHKIRSYSQLCSSSLSGVETMQIFVLYSDTLCKPACDIDSDKLKSVRKIVTGTKSVTSK